MNQTADISAGPPSAGSSSPSDAGSDIRERLMQAGLHEFAHFGFKGARLERIAAAADCAKRMIYYYFGDKEAFYIAVLNEAYSAIRSSEAQLDLDALPPSEALHRLVRNSFDYHDRNVDFTRLVLVENLQDGAMMARLGGDALRLRAAALEPLDRILRRGAQQGVFRDGLNAADVHYFISALSAFRIDHSGTWKTLLNVDLLSPEVRQRHLDMLLTTLDAHVLKPPVPVAL
ncbi:TetR family transcriptional regulator [Paenirhodobacter enshiensis]|uniref:TetR family transcriptional regulator n=1 Tax=Paenirhodobacter enshiensis TaxID=1105367 RepID=UPI0035B14D31